MKKKVKISKEEYRTIIDSIELLDITLISSNSIYDKNSMTPDLDVSTKSKMKLNDNEKSFSILVTFDMIAKDKGKEKPALKLKASFEIEYLKKNEVSITKEFLDIFQQLSVKYKIWPYFREYVYSSTSRMNLAPLTLPILK